jgi:endonuclease III
MLPQKELRKQAERLQRSAVAKYGEMKNRKPRPPLEQLIMSLFCRRTSVGQATRALRELKRSFVDWNEVRVSHPAELCNGLPATQWARVGAEQLVWLLRDLYERYSCTDLDFLVDLTPTQARSCLQSLPAVQRDMADEVLLMSLDVAVLPFSAAVSRMCHRLGLTENDRPTLKNQRALCRLLDPECYPSLHLFFCDYAERLCEVEEPACTQCPLKGHCKAPG